MEKIFFGITVVGAVAMAASCVADVFLTGKIHWRITDRLMLAGQLAFLFGFAGIILVSL